MTRVRELAKWLFREDHPVNPNDPYGPVPRLSDLWESHQEEYMKRAENELLRAEERKRGNYV